MDIGIISVRYARALFKASIEEKCEEEVYASMQSLFKAFIDVNELREAMGSPTIQKKQKEQLIATACGGVETNVLKRFITLVLNESREQYFQFISASYIALYRQSKNIISGKLITATNISSQMEKEMADMIRKRTQGMVEFQTQVDPSIIGGFILEYDTYRMDASVKKNLNNLLVFLKDN